MAQQVILDVDTGTDDAVAILVTALSPVIELKAITVAHGNQPLELTVENTLRVVELLGKDIAVYAGCPAPMVRGLSPGRAENVRCQTTSTVVDGEEIGIHEKRLALPPATRSAEKDHACSYLVNTLGEAGSVGERITLLAVAPLTNIGMALRMDPSIVAGIKEVVVMGGGAFHGNRTPVAEANFYDDPEAAQILISSGCPVRIMTLEATEKVPFDELDVAAFRTSSQIGTFVANLLEGYLYRCRKLGILEGGEAVAVHDAVAACAVIDPSVVTSLQVKNCDVDFGGGFADGQLVIDERAFITPSGSVSVAYDVDAARCREIIRGTITGSLQ